MDFKFFILLLSLWFAYAGNSNERQNRCNLWSTLRNKASQLSCPDGKFYYAVWVTHNETHIEGCFEIRMVPRGQMLIIDHKSGHLNSVDCPKETIQLQPYLSYTECGCSEVKSRCNKQGQVIVYNGSTFEDRSCRCDYIGGYAFVNISAGKCSCNPKTEICTCRRKDCETGYKLSQDYTCMKEEEFRINTFTCPTFSERIHREKTSLPPIETNKTDQVLVWATVLAIIIPTVFITSIVSFAIGVAVEKKKNVCEKVSRLFNPTKKNTIELQQHSYGNQYAEHTTRTSIVVDVPIQETIDVPNVDIESVLDIEVSNQGSLYAVHDSNGSPGITNGFLIQETTEENDIANALSLKGPLPIECTEEKDVYRKSTESIASNVQFLRGNKHSENDMKPSPVMVASSSIQRTADENSVTKASIHDFKGKIVTTTKRSIPVECTEDKNVNQQKLKEELGDVLFPRVDLEIDDIIHSNEPLLGKKRLNLIEKFTKSDTDQQFSFAFAQNYQVVMTVAKDGGKGVRPDCYCNIWQIVIKGFNEHGKNLSSMSQ